MHIWIMSDLHLNDLPLEISTPSPIPDVLVVAGDAMAPSPAAFHSQCLRGRQSRLGSAPPPQDLPRTRHLAADLSHRKLENCSRRNRAERGLQRGQVGWEIQTIPLPETRLRSLAATVICTVSPVHVAQPNSIGVNNSSSKFLLDGNAVGKASRSDDF